MKSFEVTVKIETQGEPDFVTIERLVARALAGHASAFAAHGAMAWVEKVVAPTTNLNEVIERKSHER